MNFVKKPRDKRRSENFETRPVFEELKEISKSSSNLAARDWKVSKIESPIELKLKKIKLKKHRASKISSLKTTISKKQRMEKKKRETIKKTSNIKQSYVVHRLKSVQFLQIFGNTGFEPITYSV